MKFADRTECLLFLSSYIPLIKLDHWWIRIFDYPRFQKLLIHLLLILAWWIFGENRLENLIWTGWLGVGVIYLFSQVYPYTFFGKKNDRQSPFPIGQWHPPDHL